MSINTINSTVKHAESIVNKLKATDKLPFTDVLSPQSVNEKFNGIPYRERVYSPDITVYGFLSQALGADQSQQATVSQIIAHFVSQGKEPPSANTSAYSQARSRLPEGVLSNLAREAAIYLEKEADARWMDVERKACQNARWHNSINARYA